MDLELREIQRLYSMTPEDRLLRDRYRHVLARTSSPVSDLSLLEIGDIVRGYDRLMECYQTSYVKKIGEDYVVLDQERDLISGYPLGVWTFVLSYDDEIVLIQPRE